MVLLKKSYSLQNVDSSIRCPPCSFDNAEGRLEKASKALTVKPVAPAKQNPFLGFFYTLMTSMSLTLSSATAKRVSFMSTNQLSLVRNAGVLAGCLPIAVYCAKEVLGPKEKRKLLIIQGIFGANALYLILVAFRNMPLAEAAIVMSFLPPLTSVVAYFYLKERCGLIQILCTVMTFCGILLSVGLPELLRNRGDTPFNSVYLEGLAACAGGLVSLTLSYMTLRKTTDIHYAVKLLYVGILGVAENAAINVISMDFASAGCGLDSILVMLTTVLCFVGACTTALALEGEAAGIVAVVKCSLDIVVAVVLQIIFFDDDIDVYNITGACLVIASVSLMGFSKWLQMLPEDSKVRKKLKCLL